MSSSQPTSVRSSTLQFYRNCLKQVLVPIYASYIVFTYDMPIQLRGNQKDFNFQLHHRLSKFEVPVVVNLKHIFELFGLYFLIQKLLELITSSSDGQFWRKGQNKKGGKFVLTHSINYSDLMRIFSSQITHCVFVADDEGL